MNLVFEFKCILLGVLAKRLMVFDALTKSDGHSNHKTKLATTEWMSTFVNFPKKQNSVLNSSLHLGQAVVKTSEVVEETPR